MTNYVNAELIFQCDTFGGAYTRPLPPWRCRSSATSASSSRRRSSAWRRRRRAGRDAPGTPTRISAWLWVTFTPRDISTNRHEKRFARSHVRRLVLHFWSIWRRGSVNCSSSPISIWQKYNDNYYIYFIMLKIYVIISMIMIFVTFSLIWLILIIIFVLLYFLTSSITNLQKSRLFSIIVLVHKTWNITIRFYLQKVVSSTKCFKRGTRYPIFS